MLLWNRVWIPSSGGRFAITRTGHRCYQLLCGTRGLKLESSRAPCYGFNSVLTYKWLTPWPQAPMNLLLGSPAKDRKTYIYILILVARSSWAFWTRGLPFYFHFSLGQSKYLRQGPTGTPRNLWQHPQGSEQACYIIRCTLITAGSGPVSGCEMEVNVH